MLLEVVRGPEGSALYRVLCSLGPFPVTFKRLSRAGNSRVACRLQRHPNFHFRSGWGLHSPETLWALRQATRC